MKNTKPPSTSKESTLSANFRQKAAVLQLRGPRQFGHIQVQSLPRLPGRGPVGILTVGPHHLLCAIGRNGIGLKWREGDGVTPCGQFHVVDWLQRVDNSRLFRANFYRIATTDGWCDDPESFCYNRKVRLPFRAGAETLWRDDGIYDLIGIMDYNWRPRILGRGSAIFFHLAHRDYRPTAGCLALARADMRRIQSFISNYVRIDIGIYPLRRLPKMAEPTRT